MQMLPPITDKQRSLIFFAIVRLLLTLALIQRLSRMPGTGLTTHNDMALDPVAQDVKQGGISASLALAKGLAAEQGRVAYYGALVFFLVPYFVNSDHYLHELRIQLERLEPVR